MVCFRHTKNQAKHFFTSGFFNTFCYINTTYIQIKSYTNKKSFNANVPKVFRAFAEKNKGETAITERITFYHLLTCVRYSSIHSRIGDKYSQKIALRFVAHGTEVIPSAN